MKESLCTLTPQFSVRRMLKEYTEELYYPPAKVEEKPETTRELG
jgi:hypothetical protein